MCHSGSAVGLGPCLTPQPPVKGSEHETCTIIPEGLVAEVPPALATNVSFWVAVPVTSVVVLLVCSKRNRYSMACAPPAAATETTATVRPATSMSDISRASHRRRWSVSSK